MRSICLQVELINNANGRKWEAEEYLVLSVYDHKSISYLAHTLDVPGKKSYPLCAIQFSFYFWFVDSMMKLKVGVSHW